MLRKDADHCRCSAPKLVALPRALRPPFTREDLTRRVTVVSDSSIHCCPAILWEAYTRGALHEWLGRSDQPPVIALYWNPDTGQLSRVSDADDAYLRTLMKGISSKPRRKLRWTRPFTTRCLRSLLLESSSADASSQGRTGRLTT